MIKLLFAGDVVIKQKIKLDKFISSDIKKLIKEHDFSSCNFEGPIFSPEACPIPKVGTSLCQTPEAAPLILKAGFKIINLANNHIYDYGENGLRATLDAFKNGTILGAGLDFETAYGLKIVEKNGIKIGYLSYCESEFGALANNEIERGGYAWINHNSVNGRIIEAKKRVNFLIVQAHAGVEEINLPLPEWRERYKQIIDNGADLIVGHHPHVAQGWEEYNGKLIFYSLGNFYFEKSNPSDLWNSGIILSISIDDNKIINYQVIPIKKTASGVIVNNDKKYKKSLKSFCESLANVLYQDLINKAVLKLWDERYKKFYLGALGINDKSWKKKIKKFIPFIKDENINYLLLYHNIHIESHRYCAERALSLLGKIC